MGGVIINSLKELNPEMNALFSQYIFLVKLKDKGESQMGATMTKGYKRRFRKKSNSHEQDFRSHQWKFCTQF